MPALPLVPCSAIPVHHLASHGRADVMMTSADPFIYFLFISYSKNDV
jgi:hypothetical protein